MGNKYAIFTSKYINPAIQFNTFLNEVLEFTSESF